MRSIIRKHRANIALVIGNGVNRYGAASRTNSWHDLLMGLARKHLPAPLPNVPAGVALTEFYDVLELKSKTSGASTSLQQEFCDLMASWTYYDHHERVVKWAQNADAPILTTNFEEVLSEAGGCSLRRTRRGGFTDYYPWENYYSNKNISSPSEEFAIWHVNGMQNYRRSVRLGLSHYMGSVERARGWLHKGGDNRLFSGKNADGWKGADSWLHIVFNSPLLLFGLALEETEVFLRWLLIERAKYFRKFPTRRQDAWYVYAGDMNNEGKKFFLEGVGIKLVGVDTYDDIYGAATWR